MYFEHKEWYLIKKKLERKQIGLTEQMEAKSIKKAI